MVTHGAGSSTRAQAELPRPRNLAMVLDLFRTMLNVTAAIVTEERQQEGQPGTTEASGRGAAADPSRGPSTEAEVIAGASLPGNQPQAHHARAHSGPSGAAESNAEPPATEAEPQEVFVTKRVLETRRGKYHARNTCHCLKSAKHSVKGIAVNELPAGLAECAVCFEKK